MTSNNNDNDLWRCGLFDFHNFRSNEFSLPLSHSNLYYKQILSSIMIKEIFDS
jgi:hypothetical protein